MQLTELVLCIISTHLLVQLNSDLTANSKKYSASYQNGKYGFEIDGTFYEIGGGNNLISTFSATLVSTASNIIEPPNEANYIRIKYYEKSQYVTPYVVINGTQTQLTETFQTFAISGNFTIKQTDQYSNNDCGFYIEFYRDTP